MMLYTLLMGVLLIGEAVLAFVAKDPWLRGFAVGGTVCVLMVWVHTIIRYRTRL